MSEERQLALSEWTITVLDALRLPGESFDQAVERILTNGREYQQRLDEKYAEEVRS